MGVVINRSDVYLITLDPTQGSEIRKTRPCVVVSPDDINHSLRTVIIAPMTTKGRPYVTRIPCRFQGTVGSVVLDQVRAVDSGRLVKHLGSLDPETMQTVLKTLQDMFAP